MLAYDGGGGGDVFEVSDAERLLEQVDRLEQVNNNMARAYEDLTDDCNQISNAWQSDASDRESYLSELQNNLGRLNELIKNINELARAFDIYARAAIEHASKTE